jgi:predicted ester cyclase
MIRRSTRGAALLLSVAALVSACSAPKPAPTSKAEAPAPKVDTPEERVKWYQNCWNDFNNKKWDDFKKCYAPSATSQQLGYGKENLTGPDAIVGSSQEFAKSFPDGVGEGQLILINGNHIASAYLLKGTNSGPLTIDGKQMPATNKKFGLLFGHAIETAADGQKVVKEIGVMDGGTLAAQLGLSKMPARPVMDKKEAMPKIAIAKNDAMEMVNLAAARADLEAWNKHDEATRTTADDYVYHVMASPKDENKKESEQEDQGLWKASSDVKINPSSMWAAGDYVVTTGTFDGTNDGDFPAMKLKKTGKKVSLPFLAIDRLGGGKIKESWMFYDGNSFAAQLK